MQQNLHTEGNLFSYASGKIFIRTQILLHTYVILGGYGGLYIFPDSPGEGVLVRSREGKYCPL
ncbi:MAG: hypothetical protein LBV47_08570 [Bacteroidales bacterium]|nr:hypothetical protein [Bacteroidales bacterium]